MTLEEAIAELAKYQDLDLDSKDGESPTDQEQADVLWKATKDVYEEVGYPYTTVAFSPDALDQTFALQDDEYGTSPKIGAYMFDVSKVFISSTPLIGPTGLPGLYGWCEFDELYFPDWRTAGDGTPSAAAVDPEGTLTFDKPFSTAALLLDDILLSGPGCPRRFDGVVDLSSEWAVHDRMRWAVIRRACEFASEAYSRSYEALAYLDRLGNLADRDLSKVRRWIESSASTLSSPAFNDPRRYLDY